RRPRLGRIRVLHAWNAGPTASPHTPPPRRPLPRCPLSGSSPCRYLRSRCSAPLSAYRARRFLTESLDELQRAIPGVVRGLRELFLLTVEKAVRRPVVDDDLMLDPGRAQGCFERSVLDLRDVLVGARLERENRALDLARA